MPKKIIVVTKGGFLTTKDEKNIIKTDTIIFESESEEDCEKIIHGKKKLL